MSLPAKWVVTIGALLLFAGGVVVLRHADFDPRPIWLPRCLLNEWTGLHCPGCGNTRAALELARGDVRDALRQNAFFVAALPFLLWGAIRGWTRWVYPEKWRPLPIEWRWGYSLALIGLLLLFTALRNLPASPWNWLAPVPLETERSEGP